MLWRTLRTQRAPVVNQHTDWSAARCARDNGDVNVLYQCFSKRNPFSSTVSRELISLSSGVVAREGINPHNAHEVGENLLSRFHGMPFADVKFKRSEMIKSMASASKIKIRDENRAVDPLILFKRISI